MEEKREAGGGAPDLPAWDEKLTAIIEITSTDELLDIYVD